MVGRYTASGFTLLLPHTKSSGCLTLIKRVTNELKTNVFKHNNETVKIKIAFGISSFPENNAVSPDEFVKSSEIALSIAKENSSDSVHIYSSDPLRSNLA